jgi:hypothetical protein
VELLIKVRLVVQYWQKFRVLDAPFRMSATPDVSADLVLTHHNWPVVLRVFSSSYSPIGL